MKSITIKWDKDKDDETDSMDIRLEGQPSPVELVGVLAIAMHVRVMSAIANANQISNPSAANNLAETPSV